MQSKYAWWAGSLLGLVLLVSLVNYRTGEAPSTPGAEDPVVIATLSTPSSSNSTTIPVEPQPKSSSQNSPSSPVAVPKPPTAKTPVSFTYPTLNTELVFGDQVTIAWNKEPGYSGGLYLVDAKTQSVVGWLNTNTTHRQLSYSWDARTVLLSRSNPAKKDITSGTYYLKLVFDGPQNPAQSDPFRIIYPQEVKDIVVPLEISGSRFTTGPISVLKGSKLQITNRDSVSYQIKIGNSTLPSLGSNGNVLFSTDGLSIGKYEMRDENYPTLITTLTIR